MKKLLTAVPVLTALFFVSCQKEVDDIFAGNNGNNNTAGSLKRMTLTDGTDSSTTDFFYNNSGKIIGVTQTSYSGGTTETNSQTIERNSQGIIQRIITKASELAQFGIDSLVINVGYSGGRYTNKVWKITVLAVTISDSTVYNYDASGKIVSQEEFISDGLGGTERYRFDYTYTGNNLASFKGYDVGAGSSVPDIIEVYEYDAKPSALVVGNEAFVINNFTFWYSANNLKKMTVNVTGDPDTHIQTFDYIYNAVNKPMSAIVTQDGQPITAKYYYN